MIDWNWKKIVNYGKVAAEAAIDSNPVAKASKDELVKDLAGESQPTPTDLEKFKESFKQFDNAVNRTLSDDTTEKLGGVEDLKSMLNDQSDYLRFGGNQSVAKFFIADTLWELSRNGEDKQKASEALDLFKELKQRGDFEFVEKTILEIESYLSNHK